MLLYKNKTLTDNRVIRIFITDDHYLIREGFKKAIDRESDMEVLEKQKMLKKRWKHFGNRNAMCWSWIYLCPGKAD